MESRVTRGAASRYSPSSPGPTDDEDEPAPLAPPAPAAPAPPAAPAAKAPAAPPAGRQCFLLTIDDTLYPRCSSVQALRVRLWPVQVDNTMTPVLAESCQGAHITCRVVRLTACLLARRHPLPVWPTAAPPKLHMRATHHAASLHLPLLVICLVFASSPRPLMERGDSEGWGGACASKHIMTMR